MRRIFATTLFVASLFSLFSCSHSRKISGDSFVPFTANLRKRLEQQGVDLKQIQFYIDQKLILARNLGDEKVAVSSGVVRMENGRYINEVIVPAFTPGVCESTDNERLMISFEKGNNDLAFGPGSGYTYNEYVLYGTEWKNGTATVIFDSNKFRARCGSCPDASTITLVVQKNEIDKIDRKTRVLKGRTVE